MKKLIIAAAAIAFSAPAFAQASDSSEIDVGGNRTVECSINELPESVSFGDMGRRGQASAVSFNNIAVFCNQPSNVSITSDEGYLKLVTNNNNNDSLSESDFTSAANPGFSAGLDYSLTVPNFNNFGGPYSADTSFVTAGTPVTLSNVPALNDPNVRIVFDTIAEDQPLLGGTYNDELTITITTQGV